MANIEFCINQGRAARNPSRRNQGERLFPVLRRRFPARLGRVSSPSSIESDRVRVLDSTQLNSTRVASSRSDPVQLRFQSRAESPILISLGSSHDTTKLVSLFPLCSIGKNKFQQVQLNWIQIALHSSWEFKSPSRLE